MSLTIVIGFLAERKYKIDLGITKAVLRDTERNRERASSHQPVLKASKQKNVGS